MGQFACAPGAANGTQRVPKSAARVNPRPRPQTYPLCVPPHKSSHTNWPATRTGYLPVLAVNYSARRSAPASREGEMNRIVFLPLLLAGSVTGGALAQSNPPLATADRALDALELSLGLMC